MKIKVKFFDKDVIKDYLAKLSIISMLLSFVLITIDIPQKYKFYTGIGLFIFLVLIYFLVWFRANLQNSNKLIINNSIVEIKVGDLFQESGLKVIAFNEYFDTVVDNVIISESTLNGKFLKNHVSNVGKLDTLIDTDNRLKDKICDVNNNRSGKKNKYELGLIYPYKDFLLTAFTRFDNNNRAFLEINDYINFLFNFWNEIDIVYAGRSVVIPLLGSGITRFKEYNTITEQELLELLIWSFKVSRIKFTYPSRVSIIIHESKKDKINFYKLRGVNNGL